MALKDTIREQLTQSIETAEQSGVKAQWNNLRLMAAIPTENTPAFELPANAPDKDTMGKIISQIKKGEVAKFSEGGKDYEINPEQLDKKIAELPPAIREKGMGKFTSMRQMFTKDEVIDDVAEETAKGAESVKSGFGGFLLLIQAIGTWLAAMISGKPISFGEAQAQVAAPAVQAAVKERLEARAATDPDMKKFLEQKDDTGHTVMERMGEQVVAGTYKQLGVGDKAPASGLPAVASYEDTAQKDLNIPSKAKLHEDVARTVMGIDEKGAPLLDANGHAKPTLGAILSQTMKAEAEKYLNAPDASPALRGTKLRDGINTAIDGFGARVSPLVAESITDVITGDLKSADGKKPANLSKDEFTALVTNNVTEKLAKTAEDAGIPAALLGKDSQVMKQAHSEIEKQVRSHYGDMVAIAVIAENAKAKEGEPLNRQPGSDAEGLAKTTAGLRDDLSAAIRPAVQRFAKMKTYAEINGKANDEMGEIKGANGIVVGVAHALHITRIPEANAMERAADIIADGASAVFDPKFRNSDGKPISQLSQDELKDALRVNIKNELEKHGKEMPGLITSTGLLGKSHADEMAKQAAEFAAAEYSKIPTPVRELAAVGITPKAAAEALAVEKNGITGGQNIEYDSLVLTNNSGPVATILTAKTR